MYMFDEFLVLFKPTRVRATRYLSSVLLASCFIASSGSLSHANESTSEPGVIHAYAANSEYESTVLAILGLVKSGDLHKALQSANAHLEEFPKSQVGYLLRADILYAMSGQLSGVGAGSNLPDTVLRGLTHQIKNRWRHDVRGDQAHELFPSSLVHIGSHPYVMVADMSEGRLYLYRNNAGQPELVRDYYLTVGSAGFGKEVEGDNKTPIGVYAINSYIEGAALPDLYGKGAFPVDYPNRYDRFRDRTGYGIWLHGTPSDTYARSPWASEGCFVLSNDDLLDIGQYISAEARTPVILSDAVDWITVSQLNEKKIEYLALLDHWKSDWESLDTKAYIEHYATESFNFGQHNYNAWAERKYRVSAQKTFVQVDLDVESLFVYPGENDMFVVRFRQRYLSNNYSGEVTKEQYWRRSVDGDWRIIYEG